MTKTKNPENTKRKRNFVVYSLNGGIFAADKALPDDELITDEFILEEVFKSKDIDTISYTKIEKDSYKELGVDEDVRIYFSSDQEQVWNYNPIISVYMGSLVYSSVIVFVSENETEDGNGEPPMSNENFMNIVQGFIQTCTQIAYESINGAINGENNTEEKPKREIKKSPMFELSKIKMNIGILDKNKGIEVKPGKDKVHLDEYWSSHYIGKYYPDFVIKDLLINDDTDNQISKAYMLMKPGLTTFYLLDTGKVSIYFNQYTNEMFEKAYERIEDFVDDLGKDPSDEDVEREKQRALQVLYN